MPILLRNLKAVHDGLGGARDADAHAFDIVFVNARRERSAGDPHDSNWCEVDTRDAGPTIDGQPHLTRVLGTKAVEPESGEQTEHGLGDALGDLSKRVVFARFQ
jgi:hypothetical protein